MQRQQDGLGIIDALHEYGCLTDAQLALVTCRRAGTLRKQVTCLASEGLACRVSHRRGSRGRPISVSCLPDSGWDQSPSREHQLQLNDVRLAWGLDKPPVEEVRVRTWDTQPVMLPPPSPPPVDGEELSTGGHVRPDAIALFEHERTTHPLVVFIELDRGTEAMRRSSTRQSSWDAKAGLYQQAEHLARWRDWALGQAALEQEAVCRLAVVTTTPSRLANIDDTLQQTTPAIGVWLTRFTEITSRGPWAKVWQRYGERTPRGFMNIR